MYNKVDAKLDFVPKEQNILKLWEEQNLLEKMIEKNKRGKIFSFYEGPPTANGKPHIGHVFTRTIKDLYLRYHTMLGENVIRQAGWDTHGLPVEREVEKEIGSNGKSDIEKFGIEKFIELCKKNVWLYKGMWEKITERMGYSIDLRTPYVPLSNNYIESVWWSLAELYKKGLVYKDYRIVPYCPRCGTSLSNSEVAQGYKTVKDRTCTVKFKSLDMENTYYLAWTTTPWTLPSNVALAMNAKEDYVVISQNSNNYVLAKALLQKHFKNGDYKIVKTVKGKYFEGKKYKPLFDFVEDKYKDSAWYIVNADYVTLSDGTGIVHIAPAFGEDDALVGKKYNLPHVQLVDEAGKLTRECKEFSGMFVKAADRPILEWLDREGLLFSDSIYEHEYPFCWRCSTPLIYYARSSWFVRSTAIKNKLIANNNKVKWNPPSVGTGRMGGWFEGIRDWDIGRTRFWGTPLPFWICNKCNKIHVISSVQELREIAKIPSNVEIDLHKHCVDKIEFDCDCGGKCTRTPEVLDCWYDSGAMPFAALHYPFENKDFFAKTFPAEFISEGMDQTRGWFNSLQQISTAVFGKSPYKRCLPLGLVNDEFGKKMSKSLGNVVSPWEMFDSVGADAVRWYFYVSNAPWLPTSFSKTGLAELQRKFMGTLWNVYSFFVLYAEIDKYDGSKHKIEKQRLSLMDKWLISKFNSLVFDVRLDLDNYRSTESARKIGEFVDQLSNWYVRRCRERFWANGKTSDKSSAFATLYYILVELSKLIAPFVPFLAEEIYQNLVVNINKKAPISVHLCKYPKADLSLIDKDLNKGMDDVLGVVYLGRSTRNASGHKNRQPLSKILVASNRFDKIDLELADLIKDELNVKELEILSSSKEYLTYSIKPQLKTLGPKFGPLIGKIRQKLSEIKEEEATEVINKGCLKINIDGNNIILSKEDLLIEPKAKEGYVADSYDGITVILSAELTPELIAEGFAREFSSKIQNLRKDLGFEVTDHIEINISADKNVEKMIKTFDKMIRMATLADKICYGEKPNMISLKINEQAVSIALVRK